MITTVQDLGRPGFMKTGFTESGVMDKRSAVVANTLCGNDFNAPVLEMTVTGICCDFIHDTYFCISGGNFSPSLNGVPIKNNKPYLAPAGSKLTMGKAVSGIRTYLAVSGGFAVPLVMGSASTNMKIGVGGLEGRKLKAGDILETGGFKSAPDLKKEVQKDVYPNEITVRAVPGPQDDMFTDTDLKLFFSQIYCVSPFFDRMGIRLNGISLKGKDGMDIISDGIAFGSVQISRNGQPIILMADHQTTGGYAKIATVISADLPKLAQAKGNDRIRFRRITVEKAEKAAVKEMKFYNKLAGR
jgi:biotin-dependent carboxylase-like uncharacterized protein